MFVFFAREATKVQTFLQAGVIQSEARLADRTAVGPDSTMVMGWVESEDFIGSVFPTIRDTIVSINDTAATPSRWNMFYGSPRPIGERTQLTWRSQVDGKVHTATIVARKPKANVAWGVISLQVLRFLIAFAFCSVGLWAFFARPNIPAVRALALFCYAITSLMIGNVSVMSGPFAAFEIPYLSVVSQIVRGFAVFFAAFWIHLNLLFPTPLAVSRRLRVPIYALNYLLPALVQLANVWPALQKFVGNYAAFMLAGQILVGFVILADRKRRSFDTLQRRQINLVMWGSGIGLGMLGTLILVFSLFSNWFQSHPNVTMTMLEAGFVAMLLPPVAFAYAFGRWRLLEVESKIRRGTRYVLITGTFTAVFAVIGFSVGMFITRDLMRENPMMTVLVAITATALFIPALKRFQSLIERRVYPERQRLRQLIRDFLQRSLTLPDKSAFWCELEDRLREGLLVEQVVPVTRATQSGIYHIRGENRTPFLANSDFIASLRRESRPLLVDEMIASSRVTVTPDEAEWLTDQSVVLVLPLVAQSQLVGFIGISRKQEKEDYSAEELRILNSLAPQIALASENIRLIEDNVEKQRLEEQMRMARLIQQGFLPHNLPETKGLSVAARSKFSLEVAGDYYDVIALESGETVVAVGDVSGKGAGAAMLMANLQASLRTAVGISSTLRHTVGRVNDLIFRNTPPEQYITFFVAVFDPVSRSLTYVNAGHNPPAILRSNGQTVMLDTGGIVLGCIPGVAYQEATISMSPGDMIVMYTDGVSEAMNAAEEEFTDARVVEFASSRRHLTPAELVAALEREIISHRGKDSFDDDFTVLIVSTQ